MLRNRMLPALALIAGLAAPGAAQAAPWELSSAFYVWLTQIDGDASYGPLSAEVDVSVSDVLSSLEFGMMGNFRGQTDRWAVMFDFIYASSGGSAGTAPKTQLDLNQYVFQLDGGYRYSEHSEVFGGIRYVRFESDVDVTGPQIDVHHVGDASLWDPIVGWRTMRPLGEKLRLQAQADVGGGANMDLTWQAMANLGWNLSDKNSVWVGYRALAMDFDETGNRNRFGMDTTLHGPVVGLVHAF